MEPTGQRAAVPPMRVKTFHRVYRRSGQPRRSLEIGFGPGGVRDSASREWMLRTAIGDTAKSRERPGALVQNTGPGAKAPTPSLGKSGEAKRPNDRA